jgi:hypothetical protein
LVFFWLCFSGWSVGRLVVLSVLCLFSHVYSRVCTGQCFSSSLYSHRYRRASCHCERGFCRSPQAVHRDCSRLRRFPRSPHLHLRRAHFLRSVSAFPTSVLFCVRSHGVLTDADVALSVLRARQPWQAFGAYKACAHSTHSERGHFFFPMWAKEENVAEAGGACCYCCWALYCTFWVERERRILPG